MKKTLYVIWLVLLLSNPICAKDTNNINADVSVLAKSSLSWDGETLPNYPVGKPEITILKITIPPKTFLPLHKHPVINAGVLTKGKLTVITEDKKILYLNAGDSIVEVVDKWHYGKNEGNEPAEIIVFYAGVENTPITVKKGIKE